MTTNKEIISKVFTQTKGDNVTIVKSQAIDLMNLARADERKKILPKPALKDYISSCWDEGYEQGCLETKEKIKNAFKKFERYCCNNADSPPIVCVDLNNKGKNEFSACPEYWELKKELSCLETPKTECLHLNKECDENGCFKVGGEKE